MDANLRLYPWFQFFRNLLFWQATWFLYFQGELSAAEALILYAIMDITTTVLEVPSGYMADRFGRRGALLLSSVATTIGCLLLTIGGDFTLFAVGLFLLGASGAFVSGADSAILYESLKQTARDAETEAYELTAFRFSFAGLALSAALGGALAMLGGGAPFAASAAAGAVTIWVAWRFTEPRSETASAAGVSLQLRHLRDAISNRTLLWLMLLSVMMYAFGHVPFIFGQPIILETLKPLGVGEVAPFVSGVVSAAMMALSVAMSWFAMRLRKALGLTAILIFAFGLQIGLVGVMGFGEGVIVIAFLLLRKVPDSFAKPFITATMQPLLNDEGRATYLSLASLLSRLALGGSLWAASFGASSRSTMSAEEIQMTLTAYFVAGVAALALFTLTRGALNVRK